MRYPAREAAGRTHYILCAGTQKGSPRILETDQFEISARETREERLLYSSQLARTNPPANRSKQSSLPAYWIALEAGLRDVERRAPDRDVVPPAALEFPDRMRRDLVAIVDAVAAEVFIDDCVGGYGERIGIELLL